MKSWPVKKLGEMCDFYNGLWKGKKAPYIEVGVIRNTNFTEVGTLDDYDIAYIQVEKKQFENRMLKYGDIILEKSGGGPKQPVGRVVIFNKKEGYFSFSNFTSAIRVKKNSELNFNFLHRFLFFSYISGITEKIQSHSTGIRNLHLKLYKNIEIPLPPLPEQQRIVKILDEAFEAIEKAKANVERNLENAKDVLQAELESISLNGEKDWNRSQLKDLVVFKGGGTPSTKNPKYWEGNIPWVSPKDMKWAEIIDAIDHVSEEAIKESSTLLIPAESILVVVRSGILARTIPIAISKKAVTLNQDMKALIPKSVLDPKFLYWSLVGLERQLLGFVSKGATVHRLPFEHLSHLSIFLPPISEQRSIVARLNALSAETKKLEAIYQRKLSCLEELKKSLLQKAFAGEL